MKFISRSEAKTNGLLRFYTAPCRKGHDSERYTSNGACIQCVIDKGRGKSAARDHEMMRPSLKRDIARRLVMDGPEQAKALDAFALTGDYQAAAAAIKITEAQLSARRGANEGFDRAMKHVEAKFAAAALRPSSQADFRWTPANRGLLIDKYIDTGDIAEARDSVGVTPSIFQRELETNAAFADQLKEAEPKAFKHLEERAIQLALRGNDKLLTAVLKAKNPEYRDTLKIDVNHTSKLSDAELDRRLKRLGFGGERLPVIDAQVTEVPLIELEPLT
jgi:hypothetical protein